MPVHAPTFSGVYRGSDEGKVYQPAGDLVTYKVCSEGYGWVRPSPDDQRRHLESLGGEFQQLTADPGFLFQQSYLWTFVSERKDEQYALARSGLWAATPKTESCHRSAGLTLLIEHAATELRFDGATVWITARYIPGYFEYVEYTLPTGTHSAGYQLLNEDGTWIDACCT